MKERHPLSISNSLKPTIRIKRQSEVLLAIKRPNRKSPFSQEMNSIKLISNKFNDLALLGKNSNDLVKGIDSEFLQFMSHIKATIDIAKQQTKKYFKAYCPKLEKPQIKLSKHLHNTSEVDNKSSFYLSNDFESTVSEFKKLISEKEEHHDNHHTRKLKYILKPEQQSFMLKNEIFLKGNTRESSSPISNSISIDRSTIQTAGGKSKEKTSSNTMISLSQYNFRLNQHKSDGGFRVIKPNIKDVQSTTNDKSLKIHLKDTIDTLNSTKTKLLSHNKSLSMSSQSKPLKFNKVFQRKGQFA